MSEFVTTSYSKNKGLTWFSIRVSTIVATIISCIPALLFVVIFRNVQYVGFIFAITIVCGTFFLSEKFRSGKYEYEYLENILSKFKILFPKKDLNKSDITQSKIKFDANEWYLPSGEMLIAFEILDTSEASFQAFVSNLLPLLPTYSCVKFIKPQFPDKNVEIPKHLKSKNISTSEYYVFVRIPDKIGNAIIKNNLKDKITSLENSRVRLINYKKISEITEKIFFPHQETSGNLLPFFRSPIKIFKGKATGLWPQNEIASFSLAQLPEKMTSLNFQNIYNSVSDLTGCICVSIEIISRDIIKNSYRMMFNKRHNDIDGREEKNQNITDNINVKLHSGILIHAKQEQVADTIFTIDMACNNLGTASKPIFAQDLAFLDDALNHYLPNTRPTLNFRTNIVTSLKEILCYLPRPDYSYFKQNSDLTFRTVNNKLFSFEQRSDAPNLFIGDMGAGKSTLLFLNIKAHIEKKETQEVAGCYIEIGGSFRYLAYRGLADVSYIMRTLDDGNISPFSDHPLRVFKHFNTSGHQSALKFIASLCELSEFEKEFQFKVENLIADTLVNFYDNPNNISCDLADFYLDFKAKIKSEFENILDDKENKIWIIIKNLARYVDPKRFGNIFCPDKPKKFNYEKAKFYYFTTFESSLNPEEVYKPFFTFAVLVSELVAEKYSSNRANPCKVQFLIDEVARLKKYIPEDLYLNLNSQSRKEGKIPFLATQQAEDLALDEKKWGASEKYKLIKSSKRMFFYQFPNPEVLLAQFLEVPTNDLKIEQVRAIARSNLLLKEKGIYSWGYIDEYKNVYQLIIDIDKETLWGCTTHAGGIAIREACMREGLYSYKIICELLAKHAPWPIPNAAGIHESKIRQIVNNVVYNKGDCNE